MIYLFEIQRLGHNHTETIEVGADDEWLAAIIIADAHPGCEIIRKILEYPRHTKIGHA